MVRGDTGTFSVRPKVNGEYVLKDGDHLWFTVRKIKDKTILLQKDVTEFDDGNKECVYLTEYGDSVFRISYSERKQGSVKGEDLDEKEILKTVLNGFTIQKASADTSVYSKRSIEKQISKNQYINFLKLNQKYIILTFPHLKEFF